MNTPIKESAGRRAFFFLKLAVGVSLIAYLLSRMEVTGIVAAVRRYDMQVLLGGLALTLSSMLVAGLRWRMLIPQVGYLRLVRYSFIGQFYSLVLPGQIAGEAVKAWRISRGSGDAPRLVASVFIDRIVGLIALLLVAIIGIALARDELSRRFLLPAIGLIMALSAGLFLLRLPLAQTFLSAAISHMGSNYPKLRSFGDRLLLLSSAWVNCTRHPLRMICNMLLGILFQLIGVATFALLASGVGIDIAWAHWMWIVGATAIVTLLPLSVGGLGIREGALVLLLAQFNVSGEHAIALSLGIFSLTLAVALIGWMADVSDPPSPYSVRASHGGTTRA